MNTDVPPGARAFLRRCVLAACVLDDVDITPDDSGVHLAGCAPLTWVEVAAAAGPLPVDGEQAADDGWGPGVGARARVRQLLLAHRELHRPGHRCVPLAVPRGAARHPGNGWTATAVLGGALDLGAGVVVERDGRERALPVPAASALAAGVDAVLTDAQREHLEDMGALAVRRLRRDDGARGSGVLRPVGGCDVPTLLAATTLRAHLVDPGGNRSGRTAGAQLAPGVMRAVAVPDRARGWFDLDRVDPAFVVAAWSATALADQGLPRAVLVTREEVVLAPATPQLAQAVLRW